MLERMQWHIKGFHVSIAHIFEAKERSPCFSLAFFKFALEEIFGDSPSPILLTCPSQRSRLLAKIAYRLVDFVRRSTSVLSTLSCQVTPRRRLKSAKHHSCKKIDDNSKQHTSVILAITAIPFVLVQGYDL